MDGFTFFRSYYEAATAITDAATRAEFYDAVLAYMFEDSEPRIESDIVRALFLAVRPNLNKSKNKSKRTKQNQTESNEIKQNQIKPNKTKSNQIKRNSKSDLSTKPNTVTDTDTVTVTDTVINNSTPRKRFVPPTREEVQAYCAERGNNVNADKFVDYYTSKGWVVGKVPMKDWKAAVRGWEQRDKERRTAGVDNNKFNQGFESHDYDWDKLEHDLLGY